MADEKQLAVLRRGVDAWNAWRKEHGNFLRPGFVRSPDLRGALLRGEELAGANLARADLSAADLSGADLTAANLAGAILTRARLLDGATLVDADLADATLLGTALAGADLTRADLPRAHLSGAILDKAILVGANLEGATLEHTILVGVDLTDATLTGCRVHGIAAWGLNLERAAQEDLVITRPGQPEITVDDLEVAQFVHLLLHGGKIRDVVDTVGKKGVLLLGRFTEGRLAVLGRLRDELRRRGYLPMVFNFDKPETRDFTETVRVLAGLSRFVVADLTNPRSAPLELQATVPECMVPFVPILEKGQEPFAMLQDLRNTRPDRVLDEIRYPSVERLVEVLDVGIVEPAKARFAELQIQKAQGMRVRDV